MLSLLFRAGSGQRTAQSGTVPQQQASGSNVQIARTDAGNAKQSCPSVQRASDFSLEKLGGKIDGSGACEIVNDVKGPSSRETHTEFGVFRDGGLHNSF